MTTEEKFRAAVNVIKNLPKNGSYQPSNELMLRFYAYFKQATEGPCKVQKPGFWEVVKKMKWEAWNRLGNMTRDEAMECYVEELKKIVETMSYTDNVASFLGSLGSFYDHVPLEDLELLVGPVLDRMRSQPGSPLGGSPMGGSPYGSRESSPSRATAAVRVVSSLETSPASSYSASPQPPDPDDDEDEDEFKDTLESTPLGREATQHFIHQANMSPPKKAGARALANGHGPHLAVGVANGVNGLNGVHGLNGHRSDDEADGVRPERRAPARSAPAATAPLAGNGVETRSALLDVTEVVARMQADLDQVMGRLGALERAVLARHDGRQGVVRGSGGSPVARFPDWWPLRDLSPRTFALLTLWPLLLHLTFAWLQRRRRAPTITRFP